MFHRRREARAATAAAVLLEHARREATGLHRRWSAGEDVAAEVARLEVLLDTAEAIVGGTR